MTDALWDIPEPLLGKLLARRDGDDHATADGALRELLLPERLQRGRLDERDPALLALNRRKVTDVQHLTAHLMAGHDAFVTSDHHDMLRHREAIRRRTGIVIVDPVEAVQLAHESDRAVGVAPGTDLDADQPLTEVASQTLPGVSHSAIMIPLEHWACERRQQVHPALVAADIPGVPRGRDRSVLAERPGPNPF
jgi:hypothetical protein